MAPGGSCVTGAGRPYVDGPPKLNAVLTDPDHGFGGQAETLSAEFAVEWVANGTTQRRTWVSGGKSSGSVFTYTAPSDIPQNTVISWEVRASDGTAWGPWSSEGQSRCEFIYDATAPDPPVITSAEFPDDDAPHDGVGRYATFTFDSPSTDAVEYRYGFNDNPQPANILRPSTDGGAVTVRWFAEREGPQFVTVQTYDRASKSSTIATYSYWVAAGSPAAGVWRLDDPAGSGTAADTGGTAPATAGGPAVQFGQPGPGGQADQAVALTGAPDSYLATGQAGIVDTGNGFSVSAWVYLTDGSNDAVAVSQRGSGEPGFTLGYDGGSQRWKFELPTGDFDTLGTWWVLGAPAALNTWTHLTGVYDGELRKIKLYVNDTAPAVADRRSAWTSRGELQIGRRVGKDGASRPWQGRLADVTVFNRIITAQEVATLGKLVPKRLGYWQLNDAPDGQSPSLDGEQPLALSGGAGIYVPADPIFDVPALIGAGHLDLDGVTGCAAAAAPVIATDESFTIGVRVRLNVDEPATSMAVLSLPGAQRGAVTIRYAADVRKWQVELTHADSGTGATVLTDNIFLPSATAVGQHLAVVYNAFTREASFYVNGQLVATAAHTNAWRATSGLQVGRTKVGGAWSQPLAGAVDDVRVYSGAADAVTVQKMASYTEQSDL
jgi:hypothetical protein